MHTTPATESAEANGEAALTKSGCVDTAETNELITNDATAEAQVDHGRFVHGDGGRGGKGEETDIFMCGRGVEEVVADILFYCHAV